MILRYSQFRLCLRTMYALCISWDALQALPVKLLVSSKCIVFQSSFRTVATGFLGIKGVEFRVKDKGIRHPRPQTVGIEGVGFHPGGK